MSLLPGLMVVREIPQSVLGGLLSGAYTLHGGVIRHAAGSSTGGQIVAHLLPTNLIASAPFGPAPFTPFGPAPFTPFGPAPLAPQILQMATGTMLLSGLNLLVTSVGFAVMLHRLNTIEGRLKELQKDVKAIRAILEQQERAALSNALNDLQTIDQVWASANRSAMLHGARQKFGEIAHRYAKLLGTAETLELALPYEEFFCLASLAHVRCLAELGEHQLANHTLHTMHQSWQPQARRITNDILLGEHPERFLMSDFVDALPVAALAHVLDFANAEDLGMEQINRLRRKTRPWKDGLSFGRLIHKLGKLNQDQIDREFIVPGLHKLVARQAVLDGYQAQYDLLAQHSLTPSAFEQRLAAVPKEELVDGFVILLPDQVSPITSTTPAPSSTLLDDLLRETVAQPTLPNQPDFSVTIAESAIQYVLARYVAHNFAGVSLKAVDEQRLGGRLQGHLRGHDIQIDMHPGVADVRVELDGAFTGTVFGKQFSNWTGQVVLAIQAGFTVNATNQVCLDLANGEARLIEPEWLEKWAAFLITPVVQKIPPIPLFPILASFPLSDRQSQVVEMFVLRMNGLQIGEHEACLTLGLEHGDVTARPTPSEPASAPINKGVLQ